MDRLPTELLEAIFTLCCTDGGRTGCSLALASKHIREAARTRRFHSVVLRFGSASRLQGFLSLLTAQRAIDSPLKPRVKHLYISSPKTHVDDFLHSYYHRYRGSRHPAEVEEEAEEYSQERLAFIANMSLLLRTVAAELETLCLAQSGDAYRWTMEIPFHVPEAECGEFSALRELTVVGSGTTFSNAHTKDTVLYPRLSRLHLVAAATGLRRWAERAPKVSHLCVSDDRGHMYHEVARVAHRDSESNEAPIVFVGLKQFIVQPYGFARSAFPWEDQGPRFNEWELGWLTRNATQPFELRRTKLLSDSVGGWEDITLREWLDRIEGGPGCWTLPANVEGVSS